jgi:hypothetical protein
MLSDAWVPFWQALIWPVFVLALLVAFRKPIYGGIGGLIDAIRTRVEGGADLSVGKDGVHITGGEKMKDKEPASGGPRKGVGARSAPAAAGVPEIYLVHKAGRPRLDDDGRTRRLLVAALDSDEPQTLDGVQKVVYHLHPTFRNPDREVVARETNFEMRTRAWGQFLLRADVHFKDGRSVALARYLNF